MQRRAITGIAAGAVVLGFGGLYIAGYVAASDTVPRHATVEGVGIGGLSRDEAVTRLSSELADRATADLTITVNGTEHPVDPARAGLSFDWSATVDASGVGRNWDPRHIFTVLRGGGETEPVLVVDEAALTAAVTQLADASDRGPVDATLEYRVQGSKVSIATTDAVDGVALDQQDARGSVVEAYRTGDPAAAIATVTAAAVTTAEVEEVATTVAKPAVAAPVTITITGSDSFNLTPAMIARSATFPEVGGVPAVRLDPGQLRKQATPAIDDLDLDEPSDARVEIRDGKPTVVPSKAGVDLAADDLARALTSVLTKTGEQRTATVASSKVKAAFTTTDAEKLGVKEVVGEFSTSFPYAEYRNVNLGLAASKINNTMLKPKEIFSLDDTLGPREAKYGWVKGYVLKSGRLKTELAGGISQSATTAYNAGFFAGLKDVEHHPHGLYFPRYPAGRESTIYGGSLDMRFQNDTPYGLVVQSFVTKASPGGQGSITVRIWSTGYHQIRTAEPVKSDFTSGRTIADNSPDCEDQAPTQGFTVRYYRAFISDGKEVRRENYTWTYRPGNEIRCS